LGFVQRGETVGAIHQVVERPQQEHGVDACVVCGQFAGGAEASLESRREPATCPPLRLLDVPGYGIHQRHLVALGEVRGVRPWATAHV
jgi:hypothetical protein